MAAIIGGSKRKIGYGFCYGRLSTMPLWGRFFVDMGTRGLENNSLIFFGCRGIGSP